MPILLPALGAPARPTMGVTYDEFLLRNTAAGHSPLSLTSSSTQSLGIYGPTFEERRDGPLREYAMERLPEEWRDREDR